MVGVSDEPLLIKGFVGVGKVYGQVFRLQGRWLFENQFRDAVGFGQQSARGVSDGECQRCSRLCLLVAKLHHRRKRRVVRKWCGNGLVFPRALERGSMTRRSTTILQAENRNRSKTGPVGGGGFFDL